MSQKIHRQPPIPMRNAPRSGPTTGAAAMMSMSVESMAAA